jgi:hypothetical protein
MMNQKYIQKCNGLGDHEPCAFSRVLNCVIDDESLVPLPHRVLNIAGDIPFLEDTRESGVESGPYGMFSLVSARSTTSETLVLPPIQLTTFSYCQLLLG